MGEPSSFSLDKAHFAWNCLETVLEVIHSLLTTLPKDDPLTVSQNIGLNEKSRSLFVEVALMFAAVRARVALCRTETLSE